MKWTLLGNPDVVDKLLWSRADVNKQTKAGDTPLILASYAGD